MSKSYQLIIYDLVHRLYQRPDQDTRRIILKAYLTQAPNRKLTLDELGKIPGLKKKVTRERSRQLITEFRDRDLPAEIERLKSMGGESSEVRQDLIDLEETVKKIVSEIKKFELPVFAKHIQDSLFSTGVLDQHLYIPVAIDLAKAFGAVIDFKVEVYEGQSIIMQPVHDRDEYTKAIYSFAAKSATHCCGVFSFDKLLNPDWDSSAPQSIVNIPISIRKQYVLDVLSTDVSLLLLQNTEYYAFGNHDERISSKLKPIFFSYQNSIHRTILIQSIQRSLRFVFLKSDDLRSKTFLRVLDEAGDAIDEYCRRTLLLTIVNNEFRAPGASLQKKLMGYTPGDIYSDQISILEKIRQNGGPVDSETFGEICKESLKIDPSRNGHIFSYSVVYYKEGSGRKQDYYKTLDGVYTIIETKSSTVYENVYKNRINQIKQKIHQILVDLEGFDILSEQKNKSRAEQVLIRELLILQYSQAVSSNDLLIARCQLCNKHFPVQLLIAAHVKPRAKCSLEEKGDVENIAMLQCKSCDALFEQGLISVNQEGVVIANRDKYILTDDLAIMLSQLEGNACDYQNGSERRSAYLKYHRDHILTNFEVSDDILIS